MRIDAHQHFWTLQRNDHGWLTPDTGSIYRDFLPDELRPLLAASGIAGTVLVQAAPTVAETEFLLAIADAHPFVRGVVGWVDFESADAGEMIGRLATHEALVGLRPMIQDLPDDAWMLRPELDAAFRGLEKHDLTFDALTFPRHLKHLRTLLARHPGLRTVIDHGSKPRIAEAAFDEWADDMAALARETEAFCKLSGLVTEAGTGWDVDRLRPYVSHLLETFGPQRLIWGSDWPVCTLAASYGEWLEATGRLLEGLSDSERDAVFGGNAAKAYRLRGAT